ncbi:MAG TPA: dipeptidase [Bacteroidales bacterium]|nr:dipeptidase [Bacteroidales bacterium]
MKNKVIFSTLFIWFVLLLPSCSFTESTHHKAARIHRDAITIDTHCDTPLRLMEKDFDIASANDALQTGSKVDFPRMKHGGLDASFFAVFIGQGERTAEGNQHAIEKAGEIFDAIHKAVQSHRDMATLATRPDDAAEIAKTGKRAIYIGIENGYAIGRDTSLIRKYYDLGARYMTLCHTRNNDICDSSNDTTEHNGLSAFGREVVRKMNETGMMIDVSHISDKSFFDVIALSKTPVIASHSCARAICDNPRNMNDSMLLALAKNGGVIQMCILSSYVKKPAPYPARDSAKQAVREKHGDYYSLDDSAKEAFLADWYAVDREFPPHLATVIDVVDHIDHIIKVAGIDHVGIGTDFDGGGGVDGCFDVSEMENITLELVKRGYSEEEIDKIWGGNFLRVFKEVQQYSRKS